MFLQVSILTILNDQISFSASLIIPVATDLLHVKCKTCLQFFLNFMVHCISFLWLIKKLRRITYFNIKIFTVPKSKFEKKINVTTNAYTPHLIIFAKIFYPFFFNFAIILKSKNIKNAEILSGIICFKKVFN